MNEQRTHLSGERITALRNVPQKNGMKPRGLWYSVGGDWERWCASAMPQWIEKSFYYQVDISQVHILRITTVAEMYQLNRYFLIHQEFGNTIAWERLAASFDGIEIAPYQDAFRLHPDFFWYHGWDCASGCIWNAEKVRIAPIDNKIWTSRRTKLNCF